MDRIYDLEQLLPVLPAELLQQDLAGLVTSVVERLREARHLEAINARVPAAARFDVASLRAAADMIERLNLRASQGLAPQGSLDPDPSLRQFRSFIERLEQAEASASSEMQLNDGGALADLLVCAALSKADLSPLIEVTRQKLADFDEEETLQAWRGIEAEVSREVMEPGKVSSKILPKNWLKTTSAAETKEKIADYLVTLKPRLKLALLKAGRDLPADEGLSLTSLLAFSSRGATTAFSGVQLDVATALSRLRRYWQRILERSTSDFDHALGPAASCLSDSACQDILPELPRAGNYAERLILYELKKIIRALSAASGPEDAVEEALLQYKLGLEILAPENIKDLLRKDELRLQKELCKFLLERGIVAVGTRFGPQQADLLATSRKHGYLVEAKVYKDAARLGERALKNDCAQLQNAMRRQPEYSKGILAVCNFSRTYISAPRRWINGCLWFLPINLQQPVPTARTRALTIEADVRNEQIRVVNLQVPADT